MSRRMGEILVVDDDADVLQAARLLLKPHVASVRTERDPGRIPDLLRETAYDVILLDMNFTRDVTSGQEGFEWLRRIQETDPGVVVVLITAFGGVETAVRALKEGAADFILKPWQNEKLLATVSSAILLSRSRREAARLRSFQEILEADQDHPYQEFLGTSAAMRPVFETIAKVAATDANVLILGENGTGKELVARALHRQSARSRQVFLSVDMGAISEGLFESEFFGHVKGAFTDARADRPGRFEAASGGTLFLDEIGNLSLTMQAKILRVLEERRVVRVGSNRAVPVDIRLISATNRSIRELVARGEFRQDLQYRLNTVEIHLPPLRDRGEDLAMLAQHFLDLYARKYGRAHMELGPEALRRLQAYSWPGNVRELRHVMERLCILGEAGTVQARDLSFPEGEGQSGELHFEGRNLEEVEKAVIASALARHRGNISHAAAELGITRAALYRRMEKHGL